MLDLKELNIETISQTLNKYLIDHEIDEDGDIFIESPSRVYISIVDDKRILRIMSFIHGDSLKSIKDQDLNAFIEYLNGGSYTVKYAKLGRFNPSEAPKSLICEYGMLLLGLIDESFLIRTIKHFEIEISEAKLLAPEFENIKEMLEKK